MSKIQLFTSSSQADVIWIKSKTLKYKNQLIIVSDSFTFKALTRGGRREFLASRLTPDSLRGKLVSNLVPTPLFKSKYDVSVVKYSVNLDEFITNVFSPARIEQYNIEEETDNKIVRVTVSHREMDRTIGRNFTHLRRARILLRIYFEINDVMVQKI